MGDTTVQPGNQPNQQQGDPAAPNTQPNQSGNGATPPAKTDQDDKPLGPAGERALQAERERGNRLEGEIRAMKDSMKPLDRLLQALAPGDETKGKSEVELLNEKFAKYEEDLSEERKSRWKAELAIEFGLTTKQAKRLQGATREEMAADAAELVEDFKVEAQREQQAKNGARPKPDRSQGGGSGQGGSSGKDAGLAEARRRGFLKDKQTT